MTYPGGEVITNAYLPQMAVDSVTGTDSYVGTSRYDEAGRLIHREFGFGSSGHTDYAYNAWNYTQSSIPMGGRLNHMVSVDDSHTYQDNAYRYDANPPKGAGGNITGIDDAVNGFPQTQTFTYDAINRLLSTTVTGGVYGTYSETNTYDADGNLASNASGTLIYEAAGAHHAHAVSALGTNSYTYDANGNMITRVIGGVTYTLTYDAENRLTAISGGSLTASYVYDGDGNRVRALVNDTWTNYLGNYYEATSATTTKYYYAGAQRVAWRVNTSSPYYGLSDHLGSTSMLVDVAGEVIGSQLYKAWGASRYTSGTLNTTYKYTGQREAENGLYFYNARWYDPVAGRFAQADTIIPEPCPPRGCFASNPQAWDRYAYANNNPLYYTDPSGHKPCGKYCDERDFSPDKENLWDGDWDIAEQIENEAIAEEVMYQVTNTTLSVFVPPVGLYFQAISDRPVSGIDVAFALLPLGGGVIDDIGRGLGEATGQFHHVFTKKILNELGNHENLKYIFKKNELIIRAFDKASHNGYDAWHRAYDAGIIKWLETEGITAPAREVMDYIKKVYQTADMQRRFPDAVQLITNFMETIP